MASVGAVILKACQRCSFPSINADYPFSWRICPRCGAPAQSVNLGDVAYWHRNPLMQAWYWLRRSLGYGTV